MAAKKTKISKTTPTQKQSPLRMAQKMVAHRPAVTKTDHDAFQAQFSEQECVERGAKTKARNVLSDAERGIGIVRDAVDAGKVRGFLANRLTYLCVCMVMLQHEIERQEGKTGEAQRAKRDTTLAKASAERSWLAEGLEMATQGDDAMHARVFEANDSRQTPAAQADALEKLAGVGEDLLESQHGAVWAAQNQITKESLANARTHATALRNDTEATWNAGTVNDSPTTNAIEGRVLLELNLLRIAVSNASRNGLRGVTFPQLKSMRVFTGAPGKKPARAAAAAPKV